MPSGHGLLALPWTLLTPGGSSATLAAVPWDGYRYHGGKPAQGQNAIILLLFPAPRTKPGDDRGHGGRKSGFPNRKTSLNDRYFGAASIHSGNFGVSGVHMKAFSPPFMHPFPRALTTRFSSMIQEPGAHSFRDSRS